KPTYTETGYGYIEFDGNNVLSFRERPDAKTARQFIEDGGFYWNSGMFCFKAGVFLEEIEKYSPEIFYNCKKAYNEGVSEKSMNLIPEDSVDYAVLEKSDKINTDLQILVGMIW